MNKPDKAARLLSRSSNLVGALLCLCISLVGSRSFAQMITQNIAPTAITFVNNRFAGNNNGGSGFIVTGQESKGGGMRGLVRFVPTAPHGLQNRVTVNTAQLKLTLQAIGGAGLGTNAVDSIILLGSSFTQGNGVGGAPGNAAGGNAATGPAAWLIGEPCGSVLLAGATFSTSNCSASWSLGALGSLPAASGTINTTLVTHMAGDVIGSTSLGGKMESDVLGWINTPGSNTGWQIVSSTEGTNGQLQAFTSSGTTLALTYTCKGAFLASGNDCTTCTAAAKASCVISASPNSCVDDNAPATTYHCTCGAVGYKLGAGSTSCVPACTATICSSGDPGATCTDNATGYTCTCTGGFMFNGTTCVSACGGAVDPCGNGGHCTVSGGGWTCACPAPFISNGAADASCVNFCTAGAIADCTVVHGVTIAGDSCVTDTTTYHCSCTNASTVAGSNGSGNPACVDNNECAPNHCLAGGDSGAVCTDHLAPATGYSCTCSSPTLWSLGLVGGFTSCVDTNECMSVNPCINGTCTNATAGNGYTCACNSGFILANAIPSPSPTCVQTNSCGGSAQAACVSTQAGNACVNDTPPLTGYTCQCDNALYVASSDKQSCVLKPVVTTNACVVNHCIDGGDLRGVCSDDATQPSGYACNCGAGWKFDGVTCVDVDECLGGGNPCGQGTCSNSKGSYQCNCAAGFVNSATTQPVSVGGPTCVAINTGHITVTTTPGSCGCRVGGAAPSSHSGVLLLLFTALIVVTRRRLRRE